MENSNSTRYHISSFMQCVFPNQHASFMLMVLDSIPLRKSRRPPTLNVSPNRSRLVLFYRSIPLRKPQIFYVQWIPYPNMPPLLHEACFLPWYAVRVRALDLYFSIPKIESICLDLLQWERAVGGRRVYPWPDCSQLARARA